MKTEKIIGIIAIGGLAYILFKKYNGDHDYARTINEEEKLKNQNRLEISKNIHMDKMFGAGFDDRRIFDMPPPPPPPFPPSPPDWGNIDRMGWGFMGFP